MFLWFFPFTVAVVGFKQYRYTVNEGTEVDVSISITFGELERDIEVIFEVESDSALGMFISSVWCTYVHVHTYSQ